MIYIKLDGKDRLLRYDINSVTRIEELFGGKSLITMLSNPAYFGFSLIRALLWGGLRHREKGLTLDRTGILMQEYLDAGGSLGDISDKVMEALTEAGIFKTTKENEPEEDDEGLN
jgi:hypothetical protein